MGMRLDKLLHDAGWGSRSDVRQAVRDGRVSVSGIPVTDPACQLDPDSQSVTIDGQNADYRRHDYLMLHKPEGLLSATEDPRQPTVLSLRPPRYRRRGLFPVGRLDKDTTGLLLLTNDGALAHEMTSPGKRTPRVYQVTADRPIPSICVSAFARGLVLPGGEICGEAAIQPDETDPHDASVTLFEGKYHQVKRMFSAFGLTVTKLKRLSHGVLALDPDLPPGAWRPLTAAEQALLAAEFPNASVNISQRV